MEMSVSQVLGKKGQKKIYILFTEGKRSAEGVYPECHIVKNDGFTAKEVKDLELYMAESGETIEEMARGISLWAAFGGKGPRK